MKIKDSEITLELEYLKRKLEMIEESIVFTKTYTLLYPDDPTLDLTLKCLEFEHKSTMEYITEINNVIYK
jgi:hypothetical protein